MQKVSHFNTSSSIPLQPIRSHTTASTPASLPIQQSLQQKFRRRAQFGVQRQKDQFQPDRMKFSHSLVFNSVPEWRSYYINYESLKATIYRFEREQLQTSTTAIPRSSFSSHQDQDPDLESAQLLSPTNDDRDGVESQAQVKLFVRLLDKELGKMTDFYAEKERELLSDFAALKHDVEKIEMEGFGGEGAAERFRDSDEEEEDEDSEDDDESEFDGNGLLMDSSTTSWMKKSAAKISNQVIPTLFATGGHNKSIGIGKDHHHSNNNNSRRNALFQRNKTRKTSFGSGGGGGGGEGKRRRRWSSVEPQEQHQQQHLPGGNLKIESSGLNGGASPTSSGPASPSGILISLDEEETTGTHHHHQQQQQRPSLPQPQPLPPPISSSLLPHHHHHQSFDPTSVEQQQRRKRKGSWATGTGSTDSAAAARAREAAARRRRTSSIAGFSNMFGRAMEPVDVEHTSRGGGRTGGSKDENEEDGEEEMVVGFGDEEEALKSIWSRDTASHWALDTKIMFRRSLVQIFTSVSELQQFVNLNRTGFSKIIKKYDKVTDSELRSHYMGGVIDRAYPFEEPTRERIRDQLKEIVSLYARVVTRGDQDVALKQLKSHLREHVVWERNTVWREMIGLERAGWSKNKSIDKPVATEDDEAPVEFPTPVGRIRIPWWINKSTVSLTIAVVIFIILLNSTRFERHEERNCLAMLVFATILWATEAIPLFVTSMLIPFLVVTLRVIRSSDGNDTRLSAAEATKYIFSQMLSPTIFLLIGGFTLAAALSKENIDKMLARKVLSMAGTRPATVLLAYMYVACFASMWISNVAAPALCITLIQPILRTLPASSSFPKSLILGIALAANVGGQSSPISSPQNLIALDYMSPPVSWLQWFAIALPVSTLTVFAIWLILLWSFGSGKGTVINPVRGTKDKFTIKQWFVTIVSIVTIGLWCVENSIESFIGDMGIIAILPLVAFYGTSILRKQDFDNLAWSVVFLAMGGIALGKAVLSSGLLDDMDKMIEGLVRGLDIWTILAVFSCIVLVIATFISHTIASVLVVPIAAKIGASLDEPHPRLLIMATALICSTGMALPVSGFPNMLASNVENDLGTRYLTVGHFLANGIPASVVATLIIITLGYGLMRAIGL